uniref:Hypothetical chloroplast RF66 n=1 Tax=Lygodium microphyllum TaxID=148566 RepID=A0A345HHI1_9MONI|nr:hypothetical chloroplast RF66 [Lygodium microphyllum]AXG76071.1 hypothetical chloroplast RF66 [Lygodium microphyllum]
MIHMELGPGAAVGIGSIATGVSSYALGKGEPSVSRYYDFLLSSIGLLCGGIPVFQGWRLDPILLPSEMLSGGTAAFLIIENLRLRAKETEQFKKLNYQAFIVNWLTNHKWLVTPGIVNTCMDHKLDPKTISHSGWIEIFCTEYVIHENQKGKGENLGRCN